MKKKTLTGILAVIMLLGTVEICSAMQHSRNQLSNGIVVNHFCFNSAESERILKEFGYNWVLADRIVRTLFCEARIPNSFTAKVGIGGALPVALSSTAYLVWDQARRNGPNRCWCLKYRTTPHQLKLIDRTLGKIGDKIMPFGQGAGMIIEVVNQILNTASASR
ncbi:MAG: hypothetical protein WBC77_02490 [Candidatus Zixiibacteriota bacterium]